MCLGKIDQIIPKVAALKIIQFSKSDGEYFSADESLEESRDASCQSFPKGVQGVVGSAKSTLSCHIIRGSSERRSSFGEEMDALYVSNGNSS